MLLIVKESLQSVKKAEIWETEEDKQLSIGQLKYHLSSNCQTQISGESFYQ
jgi:hypothetical protein